MQIIRKTGRSCGKALCDQMAASATTRSCYVIWQSLKYMKEGVKTLLKGKIEVPVLDATAIAVSVLRNDTEQQVRSCFCSVSVNCWKSGHIKVNR